MSLVLVANRAPIRQTPQGWAPGLGGLASALLPVLEQRGGAWVAMRPPGEATPAVQRYPEAQPAFTVRRVPLDSAEFEAYYEGMSNRVLWPLAHYLVELVEPERGFREAYRSVNRRFAHAALEAARAEGSDARFWVQDYHLMLAPEMIRLGRPEATVGFFWHIPWPAPEVFRVLPSARALLKGVLGSDLVGFHTEGYAENFREGARDLLGAEIDGESVVWQGRRVRAEAHPIGIDVQHFEALAAADGVADEVAQFRADVGTEQVIVGVDRLDYTKGLLLRLDAFERMLETFPELHGRVSLFQIATPSRTSVPAYARLKQDVDQAVGRINGRFSEGTWTPVQYRYRAYNQTELAFIYASADVALVTPLRDGMNLVAHEFAACSRDGVLVLSELTGAADYLAEPAPAQAGGDQGAVLVNPYDADGLARALRDALAMPEAERRRRLEYVKRAVARLDVHAWADGFLDRLDTVANDSSSTDARDAAVGDAALGAGRAAGSPLRDAPAAPSPTAALLRLPPMPPHPDRPLLFLDYDGTLAPIVDDPAQGAPAPHRA